MPLCKQHNRALPSSRILLSVWPNIWRPTSRVSATSSATTFPFPARSGTTHHHKHTSSQNTPTYTSSRAKKFKLPAVSFHQSWTRFCPPFFNAIVTILHADPELLHPSQNHYVYTWHGKPVNAFFLSDIMRSFDPSTELRIRMSDEQHNVHNVIILTHQHEKIALIVDCILGKKEFVQPPFQPDQMKDFALYAGHTDFGDDKLAMVIDIEKLFELTRSRLFHYLLQS